MKFTLSWLKTYLNTDATTAQIALALNNVGLEVESVLDAAAALADFKVAQIVEATQHPNADRLRVCKVDTGSEIIQVVCGAPNARAGLKTVLGRPGMVVPANGMVLKLSEIRGVKSEGMLCSVEELGIGGASEGIMELPENAPVGAPFAPIIGLDDPVFDIAITPNRSDCFGVLGIARDLAAAGLGELIAPNKAKIAPKITNTIALKVDVPQPNWCPLFSGRLITGVKNGPSPQWLQDRLTSVGLRPISALVDITNFFTIDRCRPLHVFDADKIAGNLTIRAAHEGEVLEALDGKPYTLAPNMCVIADDAGIQSLAGIIGGMATGCTEGTVNVFVESALWDTYNIAKTGRALGIHSDARQRFERGVDPKSTFDGLDAATQMILDICGGQASELVKIGNYPDDDRLIIFPTSEVKRLTGVNMPEFEMKMTLQALGFYIGNINSDEWRIAPPSWRPDIGGKADLVEEIIRIVGLDRVAATPFPRLPIINKPVLTLRQTRMRIARRTLAAQGYHEAVTWSFISQPEAELFNGNVAELTLENPISSELSVMRPNLLAGLLGTIARNQARGFMDAAVMEVGSVFLGRTPEDQKTFAASISLGQPQGRHWADKGDVADVYRIKEQAYAMLAALGFNAETAQLSTQNLPAHFHPGRSAALKLGKTTIGYFGEIHPSIAQHYDIAGRPIALEFDLEAIPAPRKKPTKARAKLQLNPLQAITRDFAFMVGADVKAGDVQRAVQKADAHITNVRLFDVYSGKGKISLGLEVTLQPQDKTFTQAEIEAMSAAIVSAAAGVGAMLGG